jgi:hypothetical protein
MRLVHIAVAVFILTALPLLIVGKSLGTELLVLGGGLVAMLLLVVGDRGDLANGEIWRMVR